METQTQTGPARAIAARLGLDWRDLRSLALDLRAVEKAYGEAALHAEKAADTRNLTVAAERLGDAADALFTACSTAGIYVDDRGAEAVTDLNWHRA